MIASIILVFLGSVSFVRSCSFESSKKVVFTQYWIPVENELDENNEGNSINLGGRKDTSLKDCKGKVLATVSKNMFNKCKLEGTCKLADGRVLNHGSSTTCFTVLDQKSYPWGAGSEDNPLALYVSVAVNGARIGTKVLIKELVGTKLPNGKTHNGCVRIDDTCSTCEKECHIDFFVGTFPNHQKLSFPDKVTAKASQCEILSY